MGYDPNEPRDAQGQWTMEFTQADKGKPDTGPVKLIGGRPFDGSVATAGGHHERITSGRKAAEILGGPTGVRPTFLPMERISYTTGAGLSPQRNAELDALTQAHLKQVREGHA